MEINEIKALLSLIDDPDQEVQAQIREKIVQEGRKLLPHIDTHMRESELGAETMSLIQDVYREVQIGGLREELDEWFASEDHDLIEGALIVAKYEYPDIVDQEVRDFLSKVRQDVWLELNENLTAFEVIKVLNIVFFDEYGFSGNKEDYHQIENSFLNKVIENRRGNPLLLSILYMSIAEQLEIPIKGINLPNHFLVAYMDEYGVGEAIAELERTGEISKKYDAEANSEDVLFYINPFSRGAILHKGEIDTFLSHLDLKPEPRFYRPCTSVDMIRRMVNNLILAYQKCGELEKAEELTRFVVKVPSGTSDI